MITRGPTIQINDIAIGCSFPILSSPQSPPRLSSFSRFIPNIYCTCFFCGFSSPWVPHATNSSHWKSCHPQSLAWNCIVHESISDPLQSERISPSSVPLGDFVHPLTHYLSPGHCLMLCDWQKIFTSIISNYSHNGLHHHHFTDKHKKAHKRRSHRPELLKLPVLHFQHSWVTEHP